jgi:hypothetical protein
MRRWRTNGQAYLIEFNGAPMGSIDKAFAANVDAVGLDADVVVHNDQAHGRHVARHGRRRPVRICQFAGITIEVFEDVYAHHHPDFMRGVERGYGA